MRLPKIKLTSLNFIRLSMCIYLLSVLSFSFFQFMFVNVLLAYIPFELSLLLKKQKEKIYFFIPLLLIWFLFYPNSPYLLTDFFYLRKLVLFTANPIFFDWFNFTILSLGIFGGYILGLYSLFLVFSLIKEKVKIKTFPLSIFYITFTSIASGFAIYLGRFGRLHSFYIITQPHTFISEITESFNQSAAIFTLFLAILQIAIITMLTLFFYHAKKLITR